MAKYIVIRSDSERNIVMIGTTDINDEAKNILRNDFESLFWQKYDKNDYPCPEHESEDDFDVLLEACDCLDYEAGIDNDSAWLNDYHHVDFDWKIIESTVDNILVKPLSMKQLILSTSENGTYVQGNVLVELNEMLNNDFETFLDILSERLVGNPCLMDINYTLVDVDDGMAVIRVSGDVSEMLELDNDLFEELKSQLFMCGREALEEFTGIDLSGYEDKDVLDNLLDEIAAQMPDDTQVTFYRQYLQ